MPLLERLQTEITGAMKARDEARLSALRMIKTALQKHQIDSMKPLDEASEQQVLKSLAKQRAEASEMFRKGGRPELADKEDAERALIEALLPASASEEDLQAAIDAAIAETGAKEAKQMGAVMKAAQARLKGKTVDGRALSEKVKARLG